MQITYHFMSSENFLLVVFRSPIKWVIFHYSSIRKVNNLQSDSPRISVLGAILVGLLLNDNWWTYSELIIFYILIYKLNLFIIIINLNSLLWVSPLFLLWFISLFHDSLSQFFVLLIYLLESFLIINLNFHLFLHNIPYGLLLELS